MRVSVLLFAAGREAAGAAAVEVEVPEKAVVSDVIAALGADERLATVAQHARLAVNHTLASSNSPVAASDELALIPPVGGG